MKEVKVLCDFCGIKENLGYFVFASYGIYDACPICSGEIRTELLKIMREKEEVRERRIAK